ncbi:MarR family winged helix-turn-helix transcriptional regulator [Patulibacter sp.]|uniref:MarR family winged helix-turn-helix transcriptional regulator n=1 Tax=Patulibacter sp. TaxID=1912859 RepID=UPI002718BACC|nr:MarR family transcriptional regulator [Patulibacter sp.]MDO9410284.1 MarR family transcriptional regulator [Patulibacter sp.]
MAAPDDTTTADAVAVWGHLTALVELRRCDGSDVARDLDLPPSQLLALRHLDPEEPCRMGSLAGALACDKGNVTGIVDRLEKRGLVERRPDAGDRRVKVLALTLAGVRVRAEVERRLAAPPAALAGLDDDELAQLAATLGRVVGALRQD